MTGTGVHGGELPVRVGVCSSTQPMPGSGQDTITLLPERLMPNGGALGMGTAARMYQSNAPGKALRNRFCTSQVA